MPKKAFGKGFFEGDLKKGLRHGYGRQIDPGQREYNGQWEHDQMHGHGELSFGDGRIYEGNFVNNEMTGRGFLLDANSKEMQMGNFLHGNLHGFGTRVLKEEVTNIMVGEVWQNGKLKEGWSVMSDGSKVQQISTNGTQTVQLIDYIRKDEFYRVEKECNILVEKLTKKSATLHTKKKETKELKAKYDEINEKLELKNSETERKLQEKEEQIKSLYDLLTFKQQDWKSLQEKVSKLEQVIEMQQKKLIPDLCSHYEGQTKNNQERIEQLQQEIESFKEQLKEKESLEEQRDLLSRSSVEIDSLKKQIQEQNDLLEIQNQQSQEREKQQENLLQQIEQLKNQLKEQQSNTTQPVPTTTTVPPSQRKSPISPKPKPLFSTMLDMSKLKKEEKAKQSSNIPSPTPRGDTVLIDLDSGDDLKDKFSNLKNMLRKAPSTPRKMEQNEPKQVDFRHVLKKFAEDQNG